MRPKSLLEQLADKMLIGDDCWEWTGARTKDGYGHLKIDGKARRAHRVLYQLLVGPIPDGLDLDHLCHTRDASCVGGRACPHRRCVRPDHLEPVTRSENHRRTFWPNSRKTHCPAGHAYAEHGGTRKSGKGKGERYCRWCTRDSTRRWQKAKT